MDTQAQKQSAIDFLRMVVDGKIEEAYLKYVDMSGRHHNPFTPAGFPALLKAMLENRYQSPEKKLEVIHAIAEGDLAAVQAHLQMEHNNVAVDYFFRFQNGKIVEFWDCGQVLPVESPNQDGAF